jgi:hypothetical protein
VSGIYWAIAKGKHGYSTISNKLKLLLLNTFDDHPFILVLPNTKDTLQVTNADSKKMLVRKKTDNGGAQHNLLGHRTR